MRKCVALADESGLLVTAQDVPALAEHFLRLYNEEFGKRFAGLTDRALDALAQQAAQLALLRQRLEADVEQRGEVDRFVVDDWTEVCREDTDIERMAEEFGLTEDGVETLADVVVSDSFRSLGEDDITLVSPMGMACFDIAVALHLHDEALRTGIGTDLR